MGTQEAMLGTYRAVLGTQGAILGNQRLMIRTKRSLLGPIMPAQADVFGTYKVQLVTQKPLFPL